MSVWFPPIYVSRTADSIFVISRKKKYFARSCSLTGPPFPAVDKTNCLITLNANTLLFCPYLWNYKICVSIYLAISWTGSANIICSRLYSCKMKVIHTYFLLHASHYDVCNIMLLMVLGKSFEISFSTVKFEMFLLKASHNSVSLVSIMRLKAKQFWLRFVIERIVTQQVSKGNEGITVWSFISSLIKYYQSERAIPSVEDQNLTEVFPDHW